MKSQNALAPNVDTSLRLDWCSHAAAKFAVENWHYSKSLPTPPIVKIGVWERGKYIGCVLFSRGANNNLGKPYNLQCTEVCELTRVALGVHDAPVSKIIALCIRFLRKQCAGIRLAVSYADPNEGHYGGIYQAGGWIYTGQTAKSHSYIDKNGREWHKRQVSTTGIKPQYGEMRRVAKISDCTKILQLGKYRYLMPLDAEMKAKIEPLRKPYPKKCVGSVDSDAPDHQSGEGGAEPTSTLRDKNNVQD